MMLLGLYNYWIAIVLMMTGFYTVISRGNLIKKLIGLNVFQVSVFLLYISMGKVEDGTAPIVLAGSSQGQEIRSELPSPGASAVPIGKPKENLSAGGESADTGEIRQGGYSENLSGTTPSSQRYSNPLPHVLILTAIVVGVATTSVGLALIVRIKEAYGTIEDEEILQEDAKS